MNPSPVLYTQLLYGLHALSIAIGIVVTLLGYRTLLFGIPSLIALALGFMQRGRQRDSWIGTHLRWQWHTFCWMLLWLVAATLAFGSIIAILTRLPLLEISYIAIGAWAAWRLGRGWHALRGNRPMQVVEPA